MGYGLKCLSSYMQNWHAHCSTNNRPVSLESEKEKFWRDKSHLGEWKDSETGYDREAMGKSEISSFATTQMLSLKLGFQTVAS